MWGDAEHIKKLKEAAQSLPDFADATAMPPIAPTKVKKGKERQQPPADDGYLQASNKAAKYKTPAARLPPEQSPKSFLATILEGRADRKRDQAIIQAHKAARRQQQQAATPPRQQRPRNAPRVDHLDGLYTGSRIAHDNNSAYHDPAYNPQPAAGGGGCSSTIYLLLVLVTALFALYICLCNCG